MAAHPGHPAGRVSGDVAYAIGGQGLLSRTGDGGRHWTQLRPALAPTGLIDVLSPGTALGAQDTGDAGAILRSADGIAATYEASAPERPRGGCGEAGTAAGPGWLRARCLAGTTRSTGRGFPPPATACCSP